MAGDGKGENKNGIWNLVASVSKVLQHLPKVEHQPRPAEFKPTIYNLIAIPGFKCCNESEPSLHFHIL